METLRAICPSDFCGPALEISPAVLVFEGPNPDVEGDTSATFNQEEEGKIIKREGKKKSIRSLGIQYDENNGI